MGTATASKSEFATLCNVERTAVSNWIRKGYIHGDAIVGTGRTARIHIAKARTQLATHLDAGQRTGNGQVTQLADAPAQSAHEVDTSDATELDLGLKREKLAQIERINRKGAEDEAERQGRYVDAAEARAEMAKIARRVIAAFEGAIPEIAADVAKACNVPERDVVVALSGSYRRIRAAEAEKARKAAEALPRLKPDTNTTN